jgi:hypothetical protein
LPDLLATRPIGGLPEQSQPGQAVQDGVKQLWNIRQNRHCSRPLHLLLFDPDSAEVFIFERDGQMRQWIAGEAPGKNS